MAKIALSIKTSYLPSWGLAEGVRDLIQNARDAEIEYGAKMTVEHTGSSLRIENEGTVLPHQALLLGHTTKLDNPNTIGKFGEGLKLATLALVRAGHSVKIRSGSEVWVPSIQFSDTFQDDVLTFDIQGGRQAKNRVRIEVGGISSSQWLKMQENFLFLSKNQGKRVQGKGGALLLGEGMKGKVFVKGIFVQSLDSLQFGYDLNDANLDRDRKMIETYNLQYKTREIYLSALSSDSDLFDQFDDVLNAQSTEVSTIDFYNIGSIPPVLIDLVAKNFATKHGPNVYPVTDASEAQELASLGFEGVLVNKQRATILSKKFGDWSAIRDKLSKQSLTTYSASELTSDEKENLAEATKLLLQGDLTCDTAIEVVSFRSEELKGQLVGGVIYIAKWVLSDPDETLAVLVRERAKVLCDGTLSQQFQMIETLWAKIVRGIRRTSRYDRT